MDALTQIIEFPEDITNGVPTFHADRFRKIVSKEVRHLPVFIISITGVYRSGKSFLLNLMKTYLDFLEIKNGSDEGWEDVATKIEGGAWARSQTSVTHGIWMWSKHWIVNGVVILLMDCQGTGDIMKSDNTLDNLILYIGLQLANVQILNVNRVLQSTDLGRLHLCSEYAEVGYDECSEGVSAIFDSLLFLIRDYQDETLAGEDPNRFEDMIKGAEQVDIKRYGAGIKNAFKYITTFMLPDPGKRVKTSSETDEKKLTIADIDEDFVGPVKALFQKLFIQLPKSDSLMRGKYAIREFKGLRKRIVDSELGKIIIPSASASLEESIVNKMFCEAERFYDKKMREACTMTFADEKILEEYLNDLVDKTVAHFKNRKAMAKYKNGPTANNYMDLLLKKKDSTSDKKDYILKVHSRNAFASKLKFQQEQIQKHEIAAHWPDAQLRTKAPLNRTKRFEMQSLYDQLLEGQAKNTDQKIRDRRRERMADRNSAVDEEKDEENSEAKLERRQRENEKLIMEEEARLKKAQEQLLKMSIKLRHDNEKFVLNQEEKWVDIVLYDGDRWNQF